MKQKSEAPHEFQLLPYAKRYFTDIPVIPEITDLVCYMEMIKTGKAAQETKRFHRSAARCSSISPAQLPPYHPPVHCNSDTLSPPDMTHLRF